VIPFDESGRRFELSKAELADREVRAAIEFGRL